jgi:hypothetical protein
MYSVEIVGFQREGLITTYYNLYVTGQSTSWIVKRRFSDFVGLRSILIVQYPSIEIPELPEPSIVSYFGFTGFLQNRARSLEQFLNQALNMIQSEPQSIALREFLGISSPYEGSVNDCDLSLSSGLILQEDIIRGVLDFFDASSIVKLSQTCRLWKAVAISPMLWKRLKIGTGEYEKAQTGFLKILQDTCRGLETLDLEIAFKQTWSGKMGMSVPTLITFPKLEQLRLHALSDSGEMKFLFQELLDSILSSDAISLKSVDIQETLTQELLRTLVSISKLKSLISIRLTFIGEKTSIDESVSILLVDIFEINLPTLEEFCILIRYPESFNSSFLLPDAAYGERIGHYECLNRFILMVEISRLRCLSWPFFPVKYFMQKEQFSFPHSLKFLQLRMIVDGISVRDRLIISEPPNRSIISNIFDSLPVGIQSIRLTTIGADDMTMHPEMTPYIISDRGINWEQRFGQLVDSWAPKFRNLADLEISGPCLGFSDFVHHAITTSSFGRFVSLFPSLKRLSLVHCISSFTEEALLAVMELLIFLKEIEICGESEKLTDSLLCQLGNLRSVKNGRIKHIRLPKTRYMSSIGRQCLDALGQDFSLVKSNQSITGRDCFNKFIPRRVILTRS